MSKKQKLSLITLITLLGGFGSYYAIKQLHRSTAIRVVHFQGCDTSLWQHIYHSQRLRVIESCTQVSGVLETVLKEKDGDYHLRLKLDNQYLNLLNEKNISDQHGDLVLEPVCENQITQADAVSACKNFHGTIVIPPINTHISVLGSYVLDTEHGWMEIHPVTSLNVIKQ